MHNLGAAVIEGLRAGIDPVKAWAEGFRSSAAYSESDERQRWVAGLSAEARRLVESLVRKDPSLTLDVVRSTVEAVLS